MSTDAQNTDKTPVSRTMVFLSHAAPEDNLFTRWLALQLANEGYPVWCDLDSFLWNTSCINLSRLDVVLSRRSVSRPQSKLKRDLVRYSRTARCRFSFKTSRTERTSSSVLYK